MCECFACIMPMAHVHAVPEDKEGGMGSPGIGVRDGWKQPHRCWESNTGPLETWAQTAGLSRQPPALL